MRLRSGTLIADPLLRLPLALCQTSVSRSKTLERIASPRRATCPRRRTHSFDDWHPPAPSAIGLAWHDLKTALRVRKVETCASSESTSRKVVHRCPSKACLGPSRPTPETSAPTGAPRFELWRSSFELEKTVLRPGGRIPEDVPARRLQFATVAQDAVVVPGLPPEMGATSRPGAFGAHRFVLPDDGPH